jgi:hypothetical protein
MERLALEERTVGLGKRNTSGMAGSWQEAHRRKGWLLEEIHCTRGKLLERNS